MDWPNCSSGWPRRSAARWESELNHRASASCPETFSQTKWTVYRHRGILTTWRVVGDQPGVLTLHHDVMMTDPEMTRRMVHQIELIAWGSG